MGGWWSSQTHDAVNVAAVGLRGCKSLTAHHKRTKRLFGSQKVGRASRIPLSGVFCIFFYKTGADGRSRTGNLCFTKALLCQLSYIGLWCHLSWPQRVRGIPPRFAVAKSRCPGCQTILCLLGLSAALRRSATAELFSLAPVRFHNTHPGKCRPQSESPSSLERVRGIEPLFLAWEASVLPLYYTRLSRDR